MKSRFTISASDVRSSKWLQQICARVQLVELNGMFIRLFIRGLPNNCHIRERVGWLGLAQGGQSMAYLAFRSVRVRDRWTRACDSIVSEPNEANERETKREKKTKTPQWRKTESRKCHRKMRLSATIDNCGKNESLIVKTKIRRASHFRGSERRNRRRLNQKLNKCALWHSIHTSIRFTWHFM